MYFYKGKEVELERHVILNSATITVGDVVKLVAGGVEPADAVSDVIYGLVEGIVTRYGVPINQANSGDYDGTYTDSTKTYIAAADNQSDKYVSVDVRPLGKGETLSVELDATAATTTGSNVPGYFVSILTTDSTKLDESTAHATNQLQFKLVDNGQGDNLATCPLRGGNYVLVKVVEADVPRASQA